MTLIINGTDFSTYIQQETDISETMRKIVGPAQDTAVDGTDILDLLKVGFGIILPCVLAFHFFISFQK